MGERIQGGLTTKTILKKIDKTVIHRYRFAKQPKKKKKKKRKKNSFN